MHKEAVVTALSFTGKKLAVIDDRKARDIAKQLVVKFTGTIGLLLRGERENIINSAYEKVVELKNKGFYISDSLLREIREKR